MMCWYNCNAFDLRRVDLGRPGIAGAMHLLSPTAREAGKPTIKQFEEYVQGTACMWQVQEFSRI
jgi:hypothetical protein